MDKLKGKAALVTGSASGVGAATAIMLAEHGCNVVINYTKNEAGALETRAACEKLGVETLICRADVSSDADCRRMVSETMEKWGRIDALVNNAGTTKFCAHENLDGLSKEDFLHIYSVNLVGPFQMTRAVAPHMKKGGGGAIVNVSSIAAMTGSGSCIAYAASKGALITLTLSLARVLGPEIRVNTVCPGFIHGQWLQQGLGEHYEKAKRAREEAAPLKAVATPERVADAILYFIYGAEVITGETLMIDGGGHLNAKPKGAL